MEGHSANVTRLPRARNGHSKSKGPALVETLPLPVKRGRGRPRSEYTDQQRRTVSAMVLAGATNDVISAHLKIPVRSLARHFKKELSGGRAATLAMIATGVVARALAGDNACSFFVLKFQGGWTDKVRHEHSGPNGGPIDFRQLTGPQLIEALAALDGAEGAVEGSAASGASPQGLGTALGAIAGPADPDGGNEG